MDGRIFDNLIGGLLLIGMAIGVALVGVTYGLYWLLSHVRVAWAW